MPKDLRKAKNSVTNDYKTCKFVKEVYNIAMIDHTIKKRCCFSNNHKTINNSVSDCFSLTNFKNQCWLVIKKLFLLSSLHLTCSDGLFLGADYMAKLPNCYIYIKKLTTNI